LLETIPHPPQAGGSRKARPGMVVYEKSTVFRALSSVV